MAKRMKFSVVGLPHYTVWHLYEPSVDDLRHMEEMDREKKAREKEEQDRQDRAKKIQNEFNEPNSQWEKDKTELQDIAKLEEEKNKKAGGEVSGPISPPKEAADVNKHDAQGGPKEAADSDQDVKGPVAKGANVADAKQLDNQQAAAVVPAGKVDAKI
jgi:mannan polymerase II complex ANP1 subunit